MRNRKLVVLVISTVLAFSTVSGQAIAQEVTPSNAVEGHKSIVFCKFFVRTDKIEQREDGTTHYSSKHYNKVCEGKCEAVLTNKNNTYNYIKMIKDRIQLPYNAKTETDTAYIKWYVIKVEADGWHVDGIWVDKNTGEELPQGPIEFTTPAPIYTQEPTKIPQETEIPDNTMLIPAPEDAPNNNPTITHEPTEQVQEPQVTKAPVSNPKEDKPVKAEKGIEENQPVQQEYKEMPELG